MNRERKFASVRKSGVYLSTVEMLQDVKISCTKKTRI